MIEKFLSYFVWIMLFHLVKPVFTFIYGRAMNHRVWENLKGQWVVITGATGDIGRELALGCAARKMNIIILGRNEEKLSDLYKTLSKYTKCVMYVVDFTKSYDLSFLEKYDISLLINNAGMVDGEPLYFKEQSTEAIVKVNIIGSLELTKKIVTTMVSRKFGYIITIGSLLGDIPTPFHSTYAATKAALRRWSESLYYELKPFGVNIEYMNTAYVATQMSKIKKTSFFVPTPRTYAEAVLNSFGSCKMTVPYLPHFLVYLSVIMTPEWVVGPFLNKFLFKRRRKIKSYKEKEALEAGEKLE